MRKETGFTLIELLVVVIVIAILAAIAIPIYTNVVEKANIDICAANQEALVCALKIFDMKYDSLPLTLVEAWDKCGNEALAIVWERKKKEGDYLYLAYRSAQKIKFFIADIFSLNILHAAMPTTLCNTLADKRILKCPLDKSGNTCSYGVHGSITMNINNWNPHHLKLSDLEYNLVIIGDTDTNGGLFSPTGGPSFFVRRHKRHGVNCAICVSVGGKAYIDKEGTYLSFEPLYPVTGGTNENGTVTTGLENFS